MEKFGKMIVKGFARHHREGHSLLATAERENQRVHITGRALQWTECRQAREQEPEHPRDLGVYEKVNEREAIAKYQVSPVDTKWIDTKRAGRGAHAHQWRATRSACGDSYVG